MRALMVQRLLIYLKLAIPDLLLLPLAKYVVEPDLSLAATEIWQDLGILVEQIDGLAEHFARRLGHLVVADRRPLLDERVIDLAATRDFRPYRLQPVLGEREIKGAAIVEAVAVHFVFALHDGVAEFVRVE